MLTTLLLTTLATAQDGISEAETSYSGATILVGDHDAWFETYTPGPMTRDGKYEQTEYAYWSGNTLYLGSEDEHGNQVDAIVEFFWFESSIDRGSDFYVAVIKARTTPFVNDEWYLMKHDEKPVLYVDAYTDTTRENNAFRWDWSLPFTNYGVDSYGQVTMKSSYGIGGNAEGSAMYAETYDEEGVKAEGKVQAKGYVNSEYSVNTNYSVELWSWYTKVNGSPSEMEWSVTLDNRTKLEENAYHEYFLAMQATEGDEFIIDELTIGATTDQWWWGIWNENSVTVHGIHLYRPAMEEEVDEGDEEDEWDTGWDEWEDEDEDEDIDDESNTDVGSNPNPSGAIPLLDDPNEGGCSTLPASYGLLTALLGVLMLSRRED